MARGRARECFCVDICNRMYSACLNTAGAIHTFIFLYHFCSAGSPLAVRRRRSEVIKIIVFTVIGNCHEHFPPVSFHFVPFSFFRRSRPENRPGLEVKSSCTLRRITPFDILWPPIYSISGKISSPPVFCSARQMKRKIILFSFRNLLLLLFVALGGRFSARK